MSSTAPGGSLPIVGDVIAGKYRIDGVAGEGGMGIVYEAQHVVLGQRVAIKVLLPGALGSAEAMERFCIEARAAARIENEHVVRVMDAAALPSGAPYLVMEYLDGIDLEALLQRKGALPVAEAVDYTLQGLEALAHAHASGVIHRDLKPANLFLASLADGRQIIKMLDFGISKSLATHDDGRLTGPRVLGSPVYMSPEQLRNGPVDARSDLWSLGIVLYELLCGTPPFGVEVLAEIIASVLARDVPPLCERAPNVPRGLSEIVGRCLMRDPAVRFQDAAEVAHALAPYGSGAWAGAVVRIDRVFTRTSLAEGPSPSAPQLQRRFDSYEMALQDLEAASRARTKADREHTPASVADTLPPAGAAEPASRKPALRVLLIDESELALTVNDHLLRSAGFDVRTMTSVGELDAVVAEWSPHLVLMDPAMLDVSGDVLCTQIKARVGASVPIVILSGAPPEELATRVRTAGADLFLSKQLESTDFVEHVRNICAITYSPEDLP